MAGSRFDEAAATWDSEPRRVALVREIGEAIAREVALSEDMDLLDYGCGTGLLGLYLSPLVRSVTGADNSRGMLDVFRKKIADADVANMRAVHLDLEHDAIPDERYDVIVSGMVLHHVADTGRVLESLHALLRPGGLLCLADLDTEPGTFHGPDAEGVHHHGFDREELRERLASIGFVDARAKTATTIAKDTVDGMKDFSVFLVTARRAG